jgi:hypothetical protein
MRLSEKNVLENREKVAEVLGAEWIITSQELADYFNISIIWLRKLILDNKIEAPKFKIGRYRVFTDSQVRKMIEDKVLDHRVLV